VRAAFAVNHGALEGYLAIGVYDQDTNELLATFKINNATKVAKQIRDYVIAESIKLDLNVLEWR
jgi:hypothetical protein